jgi:aminoglycoside phosphotransferase (APT) family kinase protein
MKNRKGSPDEARVAVLYEKLTGKPMTRGSWRIEQRNFAQKIVYVEEACRSVLDAIAALEKCDDLEQAHEAVRALRIEFDFLNTLQLR